MGKSFFFNLLVDHIINMQKTPASDTKDNFAGHIYKVEFNAWTFSKGDLWSSIMYKILKDLNEQLQLEEKLITNEIIEGTVSTIEVFQQFSARDVERY
mmetsp:Transcript_58296/g.118570  ORF Transcript_58296/g.118570 Transcript_58296/m.118570 type:complete len:98 (-) Transcript_58296:1073-1366(-)